MKVTKTEKRMRMCVVVRTVESFAIIFYVNDREKNVG